MDALKQEVLDEMLVAKKANAALKEEVTGRKKCLPWRIPTLS